LLFVRSMFQNPVSGVSVERGSEPIKRASTYNLLLSVKSFSYKNTCPYTHILMRVIIMLTGYRETPCDSQSCSPARGLSHSAFNLFDGLLKNESSGFLLLPGKLDV